MTTKFGVGNIVAILLVAGAGACTSQAVSGGTGGAGGGSTTTGSGGSNTTGGGGNTVACGSGSFTPTAGVACPPVPSSGLITDFTHAADAGTAEARFGDDSTTLSGGESTYANAGGTIMSDVTGGDWHITAHVANYSGFNLYFDNVKVNNEPCNMIDASMYTGISFTIWGTTAGNAITMAVGIVDDTPTPSWFSSVDAGAVSTPGSCIPSSGSQYYHPGCADPSNAISIPSTAISAATAKLVNLTWTDFTGGGCKPNVIPSQITSISWQFLWSTTQAPYDVDIHIDNLTFTK